MAHFEREQFPMVIGWAVSTVWTDAVTLGTDMYLFYIKMFFDFFLNFSEAERKPSGGGGEILSKMRKMFGGTLYLPCQLTAGPTL